MISWQKKAEWLELLLPKPIESEHDLQNYIRISDAFLSKLKRQQGLSIKGSRIRLKLFPNELIDDMQAAPPLEVLFEDDFSLVVNKPSGLKVHGDGSQTGVFKASLYDCVSFYYKITGQLCKVRHIHRLDECTTGPVLYAKHEWAQLVFDEAMREKAIGRSYVAIVQGRLNNQQGKIDAPIGKDRHHAARRRVSETGDHAVTRYEVLEQWKDAALVRLRLETGRTHQIRVHLSHLGHPIMGDTLYGGRDHFITRQALHGEELLFEHPLTREKLLIAAPWPDDFQQLYERLQKI